jgi:hypothetical protein
MKHIDVLRNKYQERNGQPELWERDIQTFIGALTVLELEKKLSFEIITKDEAIKKSHAVELVMTDGSTSESAETAAPVEVTEAETESVVAPSTKEPKSLVEAIREKKLKGKRQEE